MKILAINTCLDCLDVVLATRNSTLSLHREIVKGRYKDVLSLIRKLLSKAKLELKDLDFLGVCVGPGSFTGIRLGLSTMKALAYVINKPLIGFKSLDLLAWAARDKFENILCVIQDAKRNNIYSAVYVKNSYPKRRGSYNLLNFHDLPIFLRKSSADKKRICFIGDVINNHRDYLNQDFPDSIFRTDCSKKDRARGMIELVRFNHKRNKSHTISRVQPFYLYPKHCQVRIPLKSK